MVNGFDNLNFLPFDTFFLARLFGVVFCSRSPQSTRFFTILCCCLEWKGKRGDDWNSSRRLLFVIKRVISNISNFFALPPPLEESLGFILASKPKRSPIWPTFVLWLFESKQSNVLLVFTIPSDESKSCKGKGASRMIKSELGKANIWCLTLHVASRNRRSLSQKLSLGLTCRILWWSSRCRFCGTPTRDRHSAASHRHWAAWIAAESVAVGAPERSMNMDLRIGVVISLSL